MRRSVSLLGCLALLLCFGVVANAQEQSGSIQGIVKDVSGAVLPGATVEARSANVVGVTTAIADASGAYRFPALPPGTVRAHGHPAGIHDREGSRCPVAVGTGSEDRCAADRSPRVARRCRSPPSRRSSTSSRTTPAATHQPTTSSSASRRAATSRAIVSTAPGAQRRIARGGIQIDGAQRFREPLHHRRHGHDQPADRRLRQDDATPSSSKKCRSRSSGYTAEYGGSTGGVISAITKSGSNQFRGSLGTYYRNRGVAGSDPARAGASTRSPTAPNTCTGTPEFVGTPDDDCSTTGTRSATSAVRSCSDKLWFYFGSATTAPTTSATTTFRNSPAP